MSVGLQRLRDEPDVIRRGAIDKGEDPALIDAALELDATRRRLLAEGEALKAERNAVSKQVGEAIKGGAAAGRARGRRPEGQLDHGRRADQGHRRRAGRDRSGPRRPAPAHPEPGRPGRPGRWRGGERHRAHVGRATAARAAARRRGRRGCHVRRRQLDPTAALGARRGARHPRQRARREDRRLRVPGLQGRRFRAPARPHQLVPRRPHPRARLHRDLAAGRGQRGQRPRDRADPRQGRPDVRRHPRRPVPGADGRGPRHEPPPRRDLRGRRPARSDTPRTRRASGGRPGLPARTRAASCACTSSTRSRWSCSSVPRTRRRPSNG